MLLKPQPPPLNSTKYKIPANMPSISQVSDPVTDFPNRFISPFSHDAIVPLYSSVPISSKHDSCLPCVICGDSNVRFAVIKEQANKFSGFSGEDETFIGVNSFPAFWQANPSEGAIISNVTITFTAGVTRIDWGDNTSEVITSGVPEGHTY